MSRRRSMAPLRALALATAGLLSAGMGCGVPGSEHDRVVSALDAEKAARAEEEKKRASAEKKAKALRAEIEDMRGRVATSDARLAALERELAALSASLGLSSAELEAARAKASELEKKSKEFEELNAALKDEIADGRIELLGNKVRLKEKILFKSGSAKLGKDGKRALATIADVFKKFGTTKIFQITGHTDNVGKSALNWELSTDRALEVVLFLTKSGVPPELMSAAGFGEFHPVCPANDTKECRMANRRIDIVLLPNMDLGKAAEPTAAAPSDAK